MTGRSILPMRMFCKGDGGHKGNTVSRQDKMCRRYFDCAATEWRRPAIRVTGRVSTAYLAAKRSGIVAGDMLGGGDRRHISGDGGHVGENGCVDNPKPVHAVHAALKVNDRLRVAGIPHRRGGGRVMIGIQRRRHRGQNGLVAVCGGRKLAVDKRRQRSGLPYFSRQFNPLQQANTVTLLRQEVKVNVRGCHRIAAFQPDASGGLRPSQRHRQDKTDAGGALVMWEQMRRGNVQIEPPASARLLRVHSLAPITGDWLPMTSGRAA